MIKTKFHDLNKSDHVIKLFTSSFTYPDTPYLYATEEDCKSVAAQVQEETTADATRPDFTER